MGEDFWVDSVFSLGDCLESSFVSDTLFCVF